MAAAALFGLYMKWVDQPISKRVTYYKSQIQRSEAQLRDLQTKTPQDVEIAKKIEGLQEREAELSEKLSDLEKQVPSRLYTSQLVARVTELAGQVKLESIKQNVLKEQTNSRMILEVKFYSTFLDAVQYVAAVESISPFLRVDEFELLEPAGKSVELGGAPVRIVISCLLSDSENKSVLSSGEVPDVGVKRDILSSSMKPTEMMSDDKFVLEGVTYDPRNPSAIINGDVFQVNSEIGGFKVKKILADSVVLTDGVQDHLLSLKAAAEKAA